MATLVVILLVTVLALTGTAGALAVQRRWLRGQIEDANAELGEGSSSDSLVRDIHALRVRRDEASAAAEQMKRAFEGTSLGILIADQDSNVTFANTAAEQVLVGRGGDAVARARLMDLIDRCIASSEQQQIDFDLYSPVRRNLRLRVVPLPSNKSNEAGVVAYIRDLTEQHRVATVRRDFVTNAGHELKTPLGALTVLAETLADADDAETRRRLASHLSEEATRMARVVDDILELAAVESLGAGTDPVVVADVLEEAHEIVAIRAAEDRVTLAGKGPPREVRVVGDQGHLVSAVVNLLMNAIKYSARDGDTVTVRYRSWREGKWVHIEVEDQGIGISPNHQERIFERFYRVDRGRSRKSGGTGLGLSIVRNVARTHGGEASVWSELGAGSTFTIKLPALEG